MTGSLTTTLPAVAALLFLITGFAQALAPRPLLQPSGAIIAIALCLSFFALSLVAVSNGGPLGFWPEHIDGSWGNQIWCDLLLGVGTAYVLLLPRARAVGMHALPWFAFIACTGSIGLLAMVARCLMLEHRTA